MASTYAKNWKTPIQAPTLEKTKTWPAYHKAYLDYMIKSGHPDLLKSNYNASVWYERNKSG